MIQVFSPTLGPAEQAAAAAVLASGWVGFGPKCLEFERAWAAHVGVPAENMVSVSCATEALFQVFDEIAIQTSERLLAGGVVMPAISFIGIANAVLDSALFVQLCDVDRHTLNPTVADIERKLDSHTVAVCIQHYGGVPSDLGPIADLCRARGVLLVEDCACAPLSYYGGKRAGTFGDFAVWSFDSMKIITSAGDGGMVYCKDAAVADRIRKATRLGQDNLSGQSASGPRWWEFTVAQPGRKAMMNDVQAAVGLVQLGRLEELVDKRAERVTDYNLRLYDSEHVDIAHSPQDIARLRPSYYCYWIQTDRRDELAAYLRERGVYTTFRYWPVHRAYNWPSTTPNADWAADHTLNLPLHANLTRAHVDYICDLIAEFFAQ